MSEGKPTEAHPDPAVRWKHMRYMAYAALAGILVYPALFLLSDSENLAGVAWPVLLSLSAVVGSYVGFTTLADVKINRNK